MFNTVISAQDSTSTPKKQDSSAVVKSPDTSSTKAQDSTKADEMKPGAAVLYNAGNDLQKAENFQGALSKYDSALAVDKDYRIYYQKGVALKKLNKLDSAETAFKNSVEAKPDFENGYNALGTVYYAKGDLEKAISMFEKALQSSKDTSSQGTLKKTISLVYYRLAAAQIQKKKYNDAIENLKKSVGYNNFDAAYLSLAKAYSETKKYDESLQAAENAIKYKESVNPAGPYYYMGIAYKNKGDKVKAKEMFNQAKADPTYKKAAEYEISQLDVKK